VKAWSSWVQLFRLSQAHGLCAPSLVPDRGVEGRLGREGGLSGEPVLALPLGVLGCRLEALQPLFARRHRQHPDASGAVGVHDLGRVEVLAIGVDALLPGATLLVVADDRHRGSIGLHEKAQEAVAAGGRVRAGESTVGVGHDEDLALPAALIRHEDRVGVHLLQDPVVHPLGKRPADSGAGLAQDDEDVVDHDLVVKEGPGDVVVAGAPVDVAELVAQLRDEQVRTCRGQTIQGGLAAFGAKHGTIKAGEEAGAHQLPQTCPARRAHDAATSRKEERGDLIGGEESVAGDCVNDGHIPLGDLVARTLASWGLRGRRRRRKRQCCHTPVYQISDPLWGEDELAIDPPGACCRRAVLDPLPVL